MTRRAPGSVIAELAPLLDRPDGCTSAEAAAVLGYDRDDTSTKLARLQKQGKIFGRKDGADFHKRFFRTQEQADSAPVVRSVIERKRQRPLVRKAGLPAVHIPKPVVGADVVGEYKTTADTKYKLDTLKRPNSRIEAAPDLPPDPRWPSFSDQWRQLRGQA